MISGKPLTIAFALLLSAPTMASSSPINIEADSSHSGSLETRNASITAGDRSHIDGNISSRNGAIDLGDGVHTGNIGSRNGEVRCGQECTLGDLSTRNGNIRLGASSKTGDIDSRNGSITLGSNTSSGRLETRNGHISIASGSVVEGPIESRNGHISGEGNNRINGQVETRNGQISLGKASHVMAGVKTRNGDIQLLGSRIEQHVFSRGGDILIDQGSIVGADVTIEITEKQRSRSGGWLWFGSQESYPQAGDIRLLNNSRIEGNLILHLPQDYDEEIPTVQIDASSHVRGDVIVDQRATLVVEGQVDGEVRH